MSTYYPFPFPTPSLHPVPTSPVIRLNEKLIFIVCLIKHRSNGNTESHYSSLTAIWVLNIKIIMYLVMLWLTLNEFFAEAIISLVVCTVFLNYQINKDKPISEYSSWCHHYKVGAAMKYSKISNRNCAISLPKLHIGTVVPTWFT